MNGRKIDAKDYLQDVHQNKRGSCLRDSKYFDPCESQPSNISEDKIKPIDQTSQLFKNDISDKFTSIHPTFLDCNMYDYKYDLSIEPNLETFSNSRSNDAYSSPCHYLDAYTCDLMQENYSQCRLDFLEPDLVIRSSNTCFGLFFYILAWIKRAILNLRPLLVL